MNSFLNFAYVSSYLQEFCMETRLFNPFKTINVTKLTKVILIEFYKLHLNGKH